MAEETDAADRQNEEWEALVAFYGEDLVAKNSSEWRIDIIPDVVLVIKDIPKDYPTGSRRPPTPCLLAPQWIMDEKRQRDLETELVSLYERDVEVAIMWVEHCRSTIEDYQQANQYSSPPWEDDEPSQVSEHEQTATNTAATRSFIPSNSKFSQPMRTFEIAVVDNQENMREIFHGEPFHPPKSGPAETMVAHVASVQSMDHVNWVLHDLLFGDKKVGQASHNMFAYSFLDETSGCLVSDSDDDGEKGSGNKLASLLELTDAQNCIVVVSRWFGGVHLGPARFKWIASVARQALEEAGFLPDKG
eukprot:scaffold2068_cov96-Cylindrotheca_fusiformis.AAC.4